MKPEQQRKILEAAAKACGLRKDDSPYNGGGEGNTGFDVLGNLVLDWDEAEVWNPITNALDTAEMCAKLGVNTTYWWGSNEVECQCFFVKEFTEFFAYRTAEKDHDNSRLKAWMFAATMVAAKIGGYEE